MAELNPTRLMRTERREYTAERGRRFAITVGLAFGVVAAITAWRDHETIARATGALFAALVAAGLLIPSRLQTLEQAWMRLAHAISKVTTPVFMGIVYFVILTPAGWIRRTFGANPIVHQLQNDSYWAMREKREPSAARKRMERQF